ncbi:hypothetical protein [Deinococcus ruber]|nr:hypothetical protein [Deinococcus ruber]
MPFSRAAPLTLTTPTGRPRNTIRERLLQHIHHTPQHLRTLSPTISTCQPATAIAAALTLHAEGLARVTQLPSGELAIARREQVLSS